MNTSLAGKVAFVTGGGSGIGAATCHAFAAAGATVVVADNREAAASTVADEIGSTGAQALAAVVDVTDESAVAAAIADAASRFGGLDIVCANAGVNGMQTPIDEMTLAEWRQTIDVNLTGTFLTVKHAIPHLREAGGGAIAMTASINGNRIFSNPGYAAYSAAKAGQSAFAKTAAIELAQWNIRVNTVLPGSVRTNLGERTWKRNLDRLNHRFTPPERWPPLTGAPAEASDIADALLFLCSDAGRHITGAELVIDGGHSLLQG